MKKGVCLWRATFIAHPVEDNKSTCVHPGKRDTLNDMQGREPLAGVMLRKIHRLVSPMVPVAAKVKAGERGRMAV